jgi:hypothetical protein
VVTVVASINPISNVNHGGARGNGATTPARSPSPESTGDIIDMKKIYVCKKTYNTIRSFHDSSEKPKYYWNVGVKAASDRIDFIKIPKWRLCVYFSPAYKFIDQAWLFNYDYTAAVIVNFDEVTVVSYEPDSKPTTINRDNKELIAYYILPNEPVKFEGPISLMEVYVKILRYIKRVSNSLNMPFGKLEDNGVGIRVRWKA